MKKLFVSNQYGCTDTLTQYLYVYPEYAIYIPTAFTPNGDGHNDFFSIKGMGIESENFDLFLFDRWGNKIWESHSLADQWDGKPKEAMKWHRKMCMSG